MNRRFLAAALAVLMMASPAIAFAQSTSTYGDTASKKKTHTAAHKTAAHKTTAKKAKKAAS